MCESAGLNNRLILGHIESFEVNTDIGEGPLPIRLDLEESHGEWSVAEVVLDGSWYRLESVEKTIHHLIAALGGGSRE